ncbi:MAG: ABC transporter permease [Nostoc sp.]
MLIKEARLGLMAAIMAGFGRVISEVGASMMVGGNIKGQTRVLTTAIVTEVGKGNYDVAMAIAYILLIITYTVIVLLTILQHDKKILMSTNEYTVNMQQVSVDSKTRKNILSIENFTVRPGELVAVLLPMALVKALC